MRSGGVRVFRDNLGWNIVEPRPGQRLWQRYDTIFATAAASGIEVFPVLYGSPAFAAAKAQHAPRREHWGGFTAFVREAVARYGAGGAFWRTNPHLRPLPPRAWQVWNEPNLGPSWTGRVNAKQYVALLKVTRTAIKASDPGARIVLAGLPPTTRYAKAPPFLRSVYRQPGVKRLFDAVALHPYAYSARTVVSLTRYSRAVMRKFGDARTPIWITEFGWGSTTGAKLPLTSNEAGQAKRLTELTTALARNRVGLGIERAFWFSWQDREPIPGESNWWALHTGLLRLDGTAKPAWASFGRFTRRKPVSASPRAGARSRQR
jgi:hypothetical protein